MHPGLPKIEKVSDTEMTAKVALSIGPVRARFNGKRDAERPRPAQRLQDRRRGTGGRRRVRQGRRHGQAGGGRRRHDPALTPTARSAASSPRSAPAWSRQRPKSSRMSFSAPSPPRLASAATAEAAAAGDTPPSGRARRGLGIARAGEPAVPRGLAPDDLDPGLDRRLGVLAWLVWAAMIRSRSSAAAPTTRAPA